MCSARTGDVGLNVHSPRPRSGRRRASFPRRRVRACLEARAGRTEPHRDEDAILGPTGNSGHQAESASESPVRGAFSDSLRAPGKLHSRDATGEDPLPHPQGGHRRFATSRPVEKRDPCSLLVGACLRRSRCRQAARSADRDVDRRTRLTPDRLPAGLPNCRLGASSFRRPAAGIKGTRSLCGRSGAVRPGPWRRRSGPPRCKSVRIRRAGARHRPAPGQSPRPACLRESGIQGGGRAG